MKRIAKIKEFLVGVRAELRKVTWTTWRELVASTGVVILTVVIIAIFLGVIDYLMQLGVIGGRYSIIQLFRKG
jgi:preprotein translocase subunit SecE